MTQLIGLVFIVCGALAFGLWLAHYCNKAPVPPPPPAHRYVIHPGNVHSRNDGELHYVSAKSLMGLYGVSPKQCIVVRSANDAMGLHGDHFTHLYPRYNGDYKRIKDSASVT